MLVPNEIGCWPCRTTFGALLACQESFRFGEPLRSPPPPRMCRHSSGVEVALPSTPFHFVSRFRGSRIVAEKFSAQPTILRLFAVDPFYWALPRSREHVWRATVVTGGDKNFDDSNRGFMRL